MSKRNASLLLILALVMAVVVLMAMFVTTTYAGALPWGHEMQLVGHCAGDIGGSCGLG